MRYAPERRFPPYAFLPGRDPHPTRDPRGHSFGTPEPPRAWLPAARWRENEEYLWGVDLYNHGFLWEAHEAWEGIWHPSKRDREQAEHLQGLIQCAAACLKADMAQPAGVERLAALGTARVEGVARRAGQAFMGLDGLAFAAAVRAFAATAPGSSEGRPRIALAPWPG